MKLLRWMQACLLVYTRRLAATSSRTRLIILAILSAAIIASLLGFAATLCTVVIAGLILPLLNDNVKRDIDREYISRK